MIIIYHKRFNLIIIVKQILLDVCLNIIVRNTLDIS